MLSSSGGLVVLNLGFFLDDLSGCFPCPGVGRGFFSFSFFGFALISGTMRDIIIIAIRNVQRIFPLFNLYPSLSKYY